MSASLHLSRDGSALRDLRRTRQRRRLGDTEWFDVAYRVYLFALVGLVAVVLASDAIDGVVGEGIATSDLVNRGPSVAGLAVVLALGLGLRSGANGGPVSVEVADVSHLLLAPIDRRSVLLRPVAQRIRAAMFALALAGGILGQFVAREVEGSRAAWAGACATFGALVGAVFASSAVLGHAGRLSRPAATAVFTATLGWQGAAVWSHWSDAGNGPFGDGRRILGPADTAGSIALWGIRQRGLDVVAIVVVAAAVAGALAVSGRLRIEPLVRRGKLVSQLRFAATVQDLRTVVLLRRQLRSEALRSTPWGARRGPKTAVADRRTPTRVPPIRQMIWRRGFRSLRRLPASRLIRLAALSIAAGVAGSLAASSSLLILIGLLAALFLLGLESIEPLSQEIDRPDLTDGLPVDRGTLFANHLVAPASLLAVCGLVAAAAASLVEPAHAAAAFSIAVPTALTGAIGPVVATVLDAAAPISVADTTLLGAPRNSEVSLVPPEFAGFSTAFSALLPVILSALGLVPVLAMRVEPDIAMALRCLTGTVLVLGMLVMWVVRRDAWGVKIRAFFEQGREQQRAATS